MGRKHFFTTTDIPFIGRKLLTFLRALIDTSCHLNSMSDFGKKKQKLSAFSFLLGADLPIEVLCHAVEEAWPGWGGLISPSSSSDRGYGHLILRFRFRIQMLICLKI